MRVRTVVVVVTLLLVAASPALAGFSGSDVFLPMAGRQTGVYPSNWYTTVWVYNPGAAAATARVYFLERGTSNPAPPWVDVPVAPGDTERLDNVVETYFHVQKFGALRVTCETQKLVVTSRVFSKGPGGGDRDSVGQDFAAVPASFALGNGESTRLLGVWQTSASTADSDFRYNFGAVETTGHSANVKFTAFDENNTELGSTTVTVLSWSQGQWAYKDRFPSGLTDNARIEAQVVGGTGRVIVYGSQIANGSQDPTTFEMQYSDSLLGIANIQHDATLKGDGSAAAPLGIADNGVTAAQLPDRVVTADKLADEAVTVHKLATVPSPLTTAPEGLSVSAMRDTPLEAYYKIADSMFWAPAFIGDITTIITAADSGLVGGVTIGDAYLSIAPLGVTTVRLADKAVTAAKLAADAPGDSTHTVLRRNPGDGSLSWAVDGLAQWPFSIDFDQQFSPVSPYVFRIDNAIGVISVDGLTTNGTGVHGRSGSGVGVLAESTSSHALSATNTGTSGSAGHFEVLEGRSLDAAVDAIHRGTGPAVRGEHANTGHIGYLGSNGYGAYGKNPSEAWGALGTYDAGVYGRRWLTYGPEGFLGAFDAGVIGLGNGTGKDGVYGSIDHAWGKLAAHATPDYPLAGVFGFNDAGGASFGYLASASYGAYGEYTNGNYGYLGSRDYGALGRRSDDSSVGYLGGSNGVYGRCTVGGTRYAGYFSGPGYFSGAITKAGGGFQIDHPLDPERRTLSHSFVESPDMKDVYDGVVVLDAQGAATVALPEWFEALNRDFRYQLTAIGAPAPNLHIAAKIAGNRFAIAGGQPGLEVSWQVTGIRRDAWANANRIPVEEDKPAEEQGTYLHPEAFGRSESLSVERVRNPEPRGDAAAAGPGGTGQ